MFDNALKGAALSAYVGNSIPCKFLRVLSGKHENIKIYCDREFFDIYKEVFGHKKVKILTRWRIIYSVIRDKLMGRKILIFHECCMPFLDLMLMLIKPRIYFIPMQDNTQRQKIASFGSSRFLCIKKRYFSPYKEYFQGEYRLVYVAKNYPSTLCVPFENIDEVLNYVNAVAKAEKSIIKGSVIVLIENYFSDKNIAFDFYDKLVDLLLSKGHTVFIKDHPSDIFNMRYSYSRPVDHVSYIQATLPIELIDFEPEYVVGLCSTALRHFGSRSLSLLGFFNSSTASSFITADLELLNSNLKSVSPKARVVDMVELARII